ncbi:MAG: alpha/beta fold hydrolase [Betaproteobacteria bacterium]|nr:alpha/beta fold hydrolase [Betaproteobacteria bacterium]
MTMFIRVIARLVLAALAVTAPLSGMARGEPIGIVIMHGKGGSPTKFVADLARTLESKGYVVANLEMPWSGSRNYDVNTGKAEEEIEAAVANLRGSGAKTVFVSGHSQGGAFALHIAGKHSVDGVIAIAPGGSVAAPVFREKLGDSVARTRQLVSVGKGNEPERLEDYEPSRGTYPIVTTPAAYVTWFDPEGAMNMGRAAKAANPQVPILWIVPKRDYPGLLKSSPLVFRMLPSNPLTRLYEPNSDHLNAPAASAEEIVRWTREVAGAPKR